MSQEREGGVTRKDGELPSASELVALPHLCCGDSFIMWKMNQEMGDQLSSAPVWSSVRERSLSSQEAVDTVEVAFHL